MAEKLDLEAKTNLTETLVRACVGQERLLHNTLKTLSALKDLSRLQNLHEKVERSGGKPWSDGESAISDRVHRHAMALISSCAAAVAFRLQDENTLKSMIETAQRELATDETWKLDPSAALARWSEFDDIWKLFPAAATYWMGYWLGTDEPKDAPRALRRVSVPIAMYEKTPAKGLIWNLDLETVRGDAVGLPLFVHPDSALLPFADDWLGALSVAAGQPRKEDMSAECKQLAHPVCWGIREAASLEVTGVIHGESNGAAAARAFYHLMTETHPDPGVLVIAKIRPGQGWFKAGWEEPPNLEFGAVDGMALKLAAAIENGMDTVIVADAHDEQNGLHNKKEAEDALKGSSARLVVLKT